mmetsp:Transcript_28924/g.35150  ORF Transcript_28924/g.35150 Transcript_28924/m.35150 type:complete len:144 (+) Transcript_28924:1937-2368(+)
MKCSTRGGIRHLHNALVFKQGKVFKMLEVACLVTVLVLCIITVATPGNRKRKEVQDLQTMCPSNAAVRRSTARVQVKEVLFRSHTGKYVESSKTSKQGCWEGWHMDCLQDHGGNLEEIPEGDWICPYCKYMAYMNSQEPHNDT